MAPTLETIQPLPPHLENGPDTATSVIRVLFYFHMYPWVVYKRDPSLVFWDNFQWNKIWVFSFQLLWRHWVGCEALGVKPFPSSRHLSLSPSKSAAPSSLLSKKQATLSPLQRSLAAPCSLLQPSRRPPLLKHPYLLLCKPSGVHLLAWRHPSPSSSSCPPSFFKDLQRILPQNLIYCWIF